MRRTRNGATYHLLKQQSMRTRKMMCLYNIRLRRNGMISEI